MTAPSYNSFDYNSFTDLTQVFDLRKGQIVPSQPIVSTQPTAQSEQMARVTLYATTAMRSRLAHSKFVDVNVFLPTVKPLFLSLSARKKTPVAAAPVITTPVITFAANSNVAADSTPTSMEVASAEPQKARTTLRLKTKVELPSLQPITRRSTVEDLAAAFRAEKALLEKKAVAEPTAKLEDAFTKRRRHPLSNKSWSELFAEAEAPKQAKNSPDLAALFKAEMKSFMAEQERMGVSVNEVPATTKFKSAAEQRSTSPQPQRRMSLAA